MAQRRMTSLEVIDTDAFLDMPQSSQLLYFHLNARADDDGFVSNPKSIMRNCGGQTDDLKILIAKKFLISFDDGVCVIKHWRINNFIRKDIYKETKYLNHKQCLFIRKNGAYTLTQDETAIPLPCGHFQIENLSVNEASTNRQHRLGKVRLDKDSIKKGENKFSPPSLSDVKNYCEERKNGIDAEQFIDFYVSKGWKVGDQKMKDWRASVRTWEKRNGISQKNEELVIPRGVDWLKK